MLFHFLAFALYGGYAYLIAIELELDGVEADPAVEVLAQSMHQDLPDEVVDADDVKVCLGSEMLKIHSEKFFSQYDSIEEFKNNGWQLVGDFLRDIVKSFFEE